MSQTYRWVTYTINKHIPSIKLDITHLMLRYCVLSGYEILFLFLTCARIDILYFDAPLKFSMTYQSIYDMVMHNRSDIRHRIVGYFYRVNFSQIASPYTYSWDINKIWGCSWSAKHSTIFSGFIFAIGHCTAKKINK